MEERVYFTLQFVVHHPGNLKFQADSEYRNWGSGHGGTLLTDFFLLTCSAWINVHPRTICPGVPSSTMGWTFPYQSLIKRMSSELVYNPVLRRHLLTVVFCSQRSLVSSCHKTVQHKDYQRREVGGEMSGLSKAFKEERKRINNSHTENITIASVNLAVIKFHILCTA